MTEIWAIAVLAVGAYCFVRGIVDLRQRRFAWGTLGVLSGIIIMTVPTQTHAVKYELPRPTGSQG